MIYTPLTKKALRLCFDAHKEQVDKTGLPYVFHPFHLAEQMDDEYSTVCALLHDVIEDTDYTFFDLTDMGFPSEVTSALRLLTHEESVPYMDYIRSIEASGNETALKVKINDLRHNLLRGSIGGHTKQVKKHTEALDYLLRNEEYILHID